MGIKVNNVFYRDCNLCDTNLYSYGARIEYENFSERYVGFNFGCNTSILEMNPYIKELIDLFHKHLNEISPRPNDATHFKYMKYHINIDPFDKSPKELVMITWFRCDEDNIQIWNRDKWEDTTYTPTPIVKTSIVKIYKCQSNP
jgi:hypothetical protein